MGSTCLIRIGLDQVSALWRPANDGSAARSAVVDLRDADAGALDGALDEALAKVAPGAGRRVLGIDLDRLAAVHVRVGVADPYFRAALMAFAKLPRSASDRALLIGERFCREHKLDKAAYEVAASPVETSETRQTLLCCAIPRPLIGSIRERLAAHFLYADFIAPEIQFGLQAAPGPGGLVLIHADYATLALRNSAGALVHMASLRRGGHTPNTFLERLEKRLTRYVALLGAKEAPFELELLADPGLPQDIGRALAEDFAHLPVRIVDGRPSRAGKSDRSRRRTTQGAQSGPFWQTMLMGAP